MKAQTIEVKRSLRRILSFSIFRPGGKKLLAKGHVISEEDARMLVTEGMNEVWVTELEEGEVGEDDAVMQVASEIGRGALEVRLASVGRTNLFTTEPCCVLVGDDLLKQNQLYGQHGHRQPSQFFLRGLRAARGYCQKHSVCGSGV
jgi:hypothetical protein